MNIDLARESPLYERDLNFVVTNSAGHEPRDANLSFRILSGFRQQQQGQQEKLIHFEITDESDPYFLYLLDIGEQDFHNLKREQSILVDFSLFPAKLIELLDLCISSQHEILTQNQDSLNGPILAASSTLNHTMSSFCAKLDQSIGLFSIIESNRFKQLTHISLMLRPGNDSAVKAYLASRLNMASAALRKLSNELESSQEQLHAETSMNRGLSEELMELRTHRDVDLQSIRAAHAQELSQLQMHSAETLEAARQGLQTQLCEARLATDKNTRETSHQISQLETSLLDEKQARAQAEFKVRELTRSVEMCEADRDRLLAENKEVTTVLREKESKV